MLYSELKRSVLSHLNRATLQGTPIPPAYSLQADDELRIPLFLNEALMTIRASMPKIRLAELTAGEILEDKLRYRLPADFLRLHSGGVWRQKAGHYDRVNGFLLQGRDYILIPRKEEGKYTVEYSAKPSLLPEKPTGAYQLQEEEEVLYTAIPYAAAALARDGNDEFLCTALYNEFRTRLTALLPQRTAEVSAVTDVYGGWQ